VTFGSLVFKAALLEEVKSAVFIATMILLDYLDDEAIVSIRASQAILALISQHNLAYESQLDLACT